MGRPSERLAERLKLNLGQRSGHLVSHVDAGKSVGAIDPHGTFQIHVERTPVLGVGELHIAPRLDVLGDVVGVLLVGELLVGTVGFHQSELAIVEVHASVIGYCSQEAGFDYAEGIDLL